jgi:integrase
MSKPMRGEAIRLFETAPRLEASPHGCPSILDPKLPMSKPSYDDGWRRILARAGLAPVGTLGFRHRAATHIADCGIPLKIGMVLTAQKTVTMFLRSVHTEDHSVRAAADAASTPDPDGGTSIAVSVVNRFWSTSSFPRS